MAVRIPVRFKAGKTGDAEFLERKIDEMVEEIYGERE
jgi:hypothetical protein